MTRTAGDILTVTHERDPYRRCDVFTYGDEVYEIPDDWWITCKTRLVVVAYEAARAPGFSIAAEFKDWLAGDDWLPLFGHVLMLPDDAPEWLRNLQEKTASV